MPKNERACGRAVEWVMGGRVRRRARLAVELATDENDRPDCTDSVRRVAVDRWAISVGWRYCSRWNRVRNETSRDMIGYGDAVGRANLRGSGAGLSCGHRRSQAPELTCPHLVNDANSGHSQRHNKQLQQSGPKWHNIKPSHEQPQPQATHPRRAWTRLASSACRFPRRRFHCRLPPLAFGGPAPVPMTESSGQRTVSRVVLSVHAHLLISRARP